MANSELPSRQVYCVSEVALMLGFSTGRVYDLIRRGLIPCVRFGRQVRVPVRALQMILQTTDSNPETRE
jgi:excisionase family DNA binding protein